MRLFLLFSTTLFTFILAQQIGPKPEIHPKLTTYKCTSGQQCIAQNTSVVLDYFWREVQDIKTGDSCLTDSFALKNSICPTVEACAKHCALDGANYTLTGVETSDDSESVTLEMFHHYDGAFVLTSPQIYILDENTQDYVLFKLLNQEISFDIDMSKSPCGVDAAFYMTGMDASGGRSALNPAGASYGTGYCDSQCWDGWPFVNGIANVNGSGVCCNEMDLWEGNAKATQLTAHPCNTTGLFACQGNECGWHKGVCDRSGCAWNPYSLGAHSFYGENKTVDTTRPFRVVTQFHTDDNTEEGELVNIRRLYVQDKRVIQNAAITFGNSTYSSMSDAFCAAAFQHFPDRGGLPLMGEALKRGMVAVLGIWSDPGDYNNWLDSGQEGPCNKTVGRPSRIKHDYPGTSVTFGSIRWGDIDSTYGIR